MNWTLGYNIYSTYAMMFNALDYKDDEVSKAMSTDKYQIYLITKRKKFFFDRCEAHNEHNISWFYILNETHDKEWLSVEHTGNQFLERSEKTGYITVTTDGVTVDVRNYAVINNMQPYRQLTRDKTPNGTLVNSIWPSDLEVIYVGQSFGNLKTRIAKHEKIKDVALQIIEDSSNEEVIVICLAYGASDNVFGFITPSSHPQVDSKSLNDLQKKAAKRVSAQQQVTLYEASLINYFQPVYNTEYKESFISRGFTSYDQIYQTDFHYVSATLVIPDDFQTRIWSQHVSQPAFIHSAYFPLETQEQKKSLFQFLHDQSVSN
jgi:hypothetical protein